MASVLEGYATKEQRFVVHLFFVGKRINAKIFIKKCLLFMLGNFRLVKRFHLGRKRFAHNEEVETEPQKWLTQQPEEFCAVGFGALLMFCVLSMCN
jgi:hypothetical protein